MAFSALSGCLLLWGASATAQQPKVNCKDPQTQMEFNICAAEDLAVADKQLNAQYAATRKLAKARDSEQDDYKDVEKNLIAAQRAWIAYRDAQCISYGDQVSGGSMQPQVIASCEADLTRKRTQELKKLYEIGN
jgi:uncharacterized protein YecT (DUF1311 family)